MFRRAVTVFFRLAIIVIVIVEVYAFMYPRNRAHPMSDRTIEAFEAQSTHRSPATQAALEVSIERDVRHNDLQHLLAFSPLLVLDAALVYFYWNYGKGERPA